jgi:hypothetical protein
MTESEELIARPWRAVPTPCLPWKWEVQDAANDTVAMCPDPDGKAHAEQIVASQATIASLTTERDAYGQSTKDMAAILNHNIIRAEAAEATIAELRAALARLVDRLDFIHDDDKFKSVWIVNQLHVGPYTGPTYEAELNAARALAHPEQKP